MPNLQKLAGAPKQHRWVAFDREPVAQHRLRGTVSPRDQDVSAMDAGFNLLGSCLVDGSKVLACRAPDVQQEEGLRTLAAADPIHLVDALCKTQATAAKILTKMQTTQTPSMSPLVADAQRHQSWC